MQNAASAAADYAKDHQLCGSRKGQSLAAGEVELAAEEKLPKAHEEFPLLFILSS